MVFYDYMGIVKKLDTEIAGDAVSEQGADQLSTSLVLNHLNAHIGFMSEIVVEEESPHEESNVETRGAKV